MRSRALGIGMVCLSLLFITQCKRKESVVAPAVAALVGTWQLIEPDTTYDVTLQFVYDTQNPPQDITPFNGSGKAPLNQYTVRLFATLDGMLSSDKLVSTQIAGSTQATNVEQAYFASLRTVARYDFPTQNQLRLFHGGQQPGVLIYKRMN